MPIYRRIKGCYFWNFWKVWQLRLYCSCKKNTTWCFLTFKYHSAPGWLSTWSTKQRRGRIRLHHNAHVVRSHVQTDDLKPCWSLATIEDNYEILQSFHSSLLGPDCVRAVLPSVFTFWQRSQPSKADEASFLYCFPLCHGDGETEILLC